MPQFQARSMLRIAWWTVTFRFVPRLRGLRARRQYLKLLASSTLFDRNWYLDRYPDVRAAGIDPALHYLSDGAGEGRDPSPQFDTRWYLDSNPDVRRAGLNPLVHYLRFGVVEGRRRKETSRTGQSIQPALSGKGPDGKALSTAAIPTNSIRACTPKASAYKLGAVPRRESQREAYGTNLRETMLSATLTLMRAIRSSGKKLPLPRKLKRRANSMLLAAMPLAVKISADDKLVASSHFDADYYLATNSDVREAGVEPLWHFLVFGWREGRNPSRSFDVKFYLSRNPDVANAGINPLLHYAWAGASEGRQPARPLDAYRRHLDLATSRRVTAAHWTKGRNVSPSLRSDELKQTLIRSVRRKGLIISVSHDDYAANCGGVQNVIYDEQQAFNQAAWSYLHVSPAVPLPMLVDAVPATKFLVGLRLDGRWVGVAALSEVIEAFAGAHLASIGCVIHHLMGSSPELILALVRAAGVKWTAVWVHDFFTLCESYTLLRNDVTYCGGPDPDSAACSICCFGPERKRHLHRMRAFFQALQPTVLAPSESALEIWRHRADFSCTETAVVPYARLVTDFPQKSLTDGRSNRPLRVAHLGQLVIHKGWPVFEQLALRFASDDRYQFFQLGISNGHPMPGSVRSIPVRVGPEQRHAMVEAIIAAQIDIVVIWSIWPETFCFTAHEALAAGAFVVAHADAGHVWPAIQANAPDQGWAVEDEAALFSLFDGDELRTRLEKSLRRRGRLLPGGSTADWLLGRRQLDNFSADCQGPAPWPRIAEQTRT